MSIFTHTLVALFFVRLFGLSGEEMLFAFLFGVAIDADEIFTFYPNLKKYGFKISRQYPFVYPPHLPRRTFLQEPVSFIWIVPLSVYLKTWVPVFFFFSHLVFDYSQSYTKKPFSPLSKREIKTSWPKFFNRWPDFLKEGAVFLVFGLLNLWLFL